MKDVCTSCGSDKIIPNARIVDRGESMMKFDLCVEVYGNPKSVMFRETQECKLTARVCGQCGHTELHVENPEQLYQRYLKGQEK